MEYLIKRLEDLDDELCDYCYENQVNTLNTNQYNLCEGRWCEDASEAYLEEYNEELRLAILDMIYEK